MTAVSARPPSADPLALPPVPPPAPDTHVGRDRIVVLLFALALALPLVGAVLNRNLPLTRFENRATAPWPAAPVDLTSARAWPTAFEAAFADRFGGRDGLIRFHHLTKVTAFGVSPVANVMIGRDGWLYFLGEDGLAVDRDHRGVVPYADDEAARIAAAFKRRHDYLAARGILYVVMIVPDKATIYPEHLPAWAAVPVAPRSRLDRLQEALAAYPDLVALDLRPALRAAKARDQVYFRSDSHWNLLGASVAYRELAMLLQARLPGFPAIPPERPPYVPGVDVYSGDLARMLGAPRSLNEPDIAPLGKVFGNAAARCARPAPATPPPSPSPSQPPNVTEPPPEAIEIMVDVCARPNLPTAVVFRDSMAIPLRPLLSENFRRTVYASERKLVLDLIERERPDVVIDEMVERTMAAPMLLPLPPEPPPRG